MMVPRSKSLIQLETGFLKQGLSLRCRKRRLWTKSAYLIPIHDQDFTAWLKDTLHLQCELVRIFQLEENVRGDCSVGQGFFQFRATDLFYIAPNDFDIKKVVRLTDRTYAL